MKSAAMTDFPTTRTQGYTLPELLIVLLLSALIGVGVITSIAAVNANLTVKTEKASIVQLSTQAATLAQGNATTASLNRSGRNVTITLAGETKPRATFTARRLQLSGPTVIATYNAAGRATPSATRLTGKYRKTTSTLTIGLVGQARWGTP